MFAGDIEEDLEWLMQRKNDFTLLELVKSEPFTSQRVFLSENCLEDGLPRMKQRYYSIANDPFNGSSDCKRTKICFTVHKFVNSQNEVQLGLCTSYLDRLNLGDVISCSVSKSTRVLTLP